MRGLVRFLSVLLVAAGFALIVYGAMAKDDAFRAPLGLERIWSTPTEVLAWGVGMLVGGILLLLTFGFRTPVMDKPGKP